MKTICATKLVPDDPAEKDAFGSHEPVAAALADLLAHETGGRAIALAGSWGSGKSTIVRLLKEKLPATAGVFVFNAWSHQGDPLRRTFLEQLIDFLDGSGWLAEAQKWADVKKDLARRRRVQDVTSTPVLSFLGKILTVLILMTPAGLVLLSRIGEQGVSNWFPAVGAILSSLPVVFIVVALLFKRTDIFEILLKESTTTTKSETLETAEPTSVEFQEAFQKVLSESLNDSERKLIIIVDNLDRLDSDNALALWSTMSTFFDFGNSEASAWLRSLWLIVPFDPSALAKLWPHAVGASDDQKGVAGRSVADLAQVFLDKTFSTTFHVPPPVLSDWHTYLINQLKIALPDHASREHDFHSVYRIYRLGVLDQNQSPAPRDIKVFVNKLGAIHRLQQDEIALPLQALYVVLSSRRLDIESELRTELEERLLGRIPVQLVGPDWRTSLASIHFNASTQKSLQLLMGGEVEAALLSKNAQKMADFRQIPGVTQVIEQVMEASCKDWSDKENSNLANAAFSLGQSSPTDDDSLRTTWNLICDEASKVKSWDRLDTDIAGGLTEMLKRRKDEAFANKLVVSLADSQIVDEKTDAPLDPATISEWLKSVSSVLSAVQDGFANALNNFTVSGSAKIYIAVMSQVSKTDQVDDFRSIFLPAASPKEVIAELVRISNAKEFDDKHAEAVRAMLAVKKDWPWSTLVDQLKSRLNAENELSSSEVKSAILTLLLLSKPTPAAKKALGFLAEQGHLGHHLHQSNTAKDELAVALCIVPIIQKIPDGTMADSPGNASSGITVYTALTSNPKERQKVIEEISNLLIEFGELKTVFELAKSGKAGSLPGALLSYIAGIPEAPTYFTPNDIIDNYDVLEDTCEPTALASLIKESITKSSLATELVSNQFELSLAKLYLAAIQAEKREDLSIFLRSSLNSLAKASWVEQLTEEGNVLDLLGFFVRAGDYPNLSIDFEDALLIHAELLIEGKATVKRLRESWDEIPMSLSTTSQDNLFRRMVELVCDHDESTDSVLELYGQRLAKESVLSYSPERLVLRGFTNFLSRTNISELRWLHETLIAKPESKFKLLDSVKAETRDGFFDRVRDAHKKNNEDEEIRKEVEAIADLLEIEFQEGEEADATKDDSSEKPPNE